MKHSIKTLVIGFECPKIILENKDWNNELNSNLIDPNLCSFTTLKNDLELIEIPNGNHLLLYTLVVLINNDTVVLKEVDEDWEKLKDSVSIVLTDYLTKQNVRFFKKLKEI